MKRGPRNRKWNATKRRNTDARGAIRNTQWINERELQTKTMKRRQRAIDKKALT